VQVYVNINKRHFKRFILLFTLIGLLQHRAKGR